MDVQPSSARTQADGLADEDVLFGWRGFELSELARTQVDGRADEDVLFGWRGFEFSDLARTQVDGLADEGEGPPKRRGAKAFDNVAAESQDGTGLLGALDTISFQSSGLAGYG